MQNKQPLVSIITVNYNQPEVTCALIDSIRAQDYPNVETIVVDNGCKLAPFAPFAANYPEVKLITSKQNLGFAGGNNLGIAAARGEYYFFVNNDAELTSDTITVLVNAFAQNPSLGAISPKLCYWPDSQQQTNTIQYAGTTPVHAMTARNRTIGEREADLGQYNCTPPQHTAYTHGAAMMVPRAVVEQVGAWPENFFLYYEELDWCEQIRRAGYSIMVAPATTVFHKESLTVGNASPLKTYYLNRNRILFMRRNRGWADWVAFLPFLTLVTIPKNILTYAIRREWPLLAAYLRAIRWNIADTFRFDTSDFKFEVKLPQPNHA